MYVNRKTKKSLVVDVLCTEDDISSLQEKYERLHNLLDNNELPPPVDNIEVFVATGKPVVSMTAITCRYHSLCTGDENWYPKAKKEIGIEQAGQSYSGEND